MLTLALKWLHFGLCAESLVETFLVPFSKGYPKMARCSKRYEKATRMY